MAIEVLAPEVIDQIAAGEVLERPAHLVKELVENSLDAGAANIEIEVLEGGRSVVVRDDGAGLSEAELALALKRHATSKIRLSSDLFQLSTFGFRGEALASAAAVSRLILTSRPRDGEVAHRLESDFGQLSDVVKVSAPVGTEIRVREVFKNVPARLRFLKSDSAEVAQIKNMLKALAMINFKVGFRLFVNGQMVFFFQGTNTWANRVAQVVEAPKLHFGTYDLDGFHCEVLVSAPMETQAVSRQMWFFVQNRWVQDRGLQAAVQEGYRNLLMHGEYPTAVVSLTVPPDQVDVNVHPTKSQVKFQDSGRAFRSVARSVRGVLEQAPWLPQTKTNPVPAPVPVRNESFSVPPPENAQFLAPEFAQVQYAQKSFPYQQLKEERAHGRIESAPAVNKGFWSQLQVLSQLNQTYILSQSAETFYLIDQHAAHERVVFEKLSLAFKNGKMDVQGLLLPLTFDLGGPTCDAFQAAGDELRRLGLEVERMGPETLAVTAYPSVVKERALAHTIQLLAVNLTAGRGAGAFEKVVHDVLATMACHSVVRAGQPLSQPEMKSLLEQMDEFPLSSFCPHGRPVYIQRSFQELDREFGRIV